MRLGGFLIDPWRDPVQGSLHPAFFEKSRGRILPLRPDSLPQFLAELNNALLQDYTLAFFLPQDAFPDFGPEVLRLAFRVRYRPGRYFCPSRPYQYRSFPNPAPGRNPLESWMDGTPRAAARYLYKYELAHKTPIAKYAAEVAAYFYAKSWRIKADPPTIQGTGDQDLALLFKRTSDHVNAAFNLLCASLEVGGSLPKEQA